MKQVMANPNVKRLLACLFGGFMLALMIGDQEGTQDDLGISFRHATHLPRLLVFLAIGVAIYLAVTFWPRVVPFIRRPGAAPVFGGFLAILAAMVLMHWYDPVGKFNPLSDQVGQSSGVPVLADLFFSWFGWALWIACFVIGGIAVITRRPLVGHALTVLGVASAILVYVAHAQLVDFAGGIDHSLAAYVAVLGYLSFACAGAIAARSTIETADPRGFIDRIVGWRPGLPLAAISIPLALIAFLSATWFSPLQLNDDFAGTKSDFDGQGIGPLATAYLGWLGWTLFVVAVALAVAGSYLRLRWLGWLTMAIGFAGTLITFISLHSITTTGSDIAPQYGKDWQNLGAGGWVACIAFSFIAVSGAVAATSGWTSVRDAKAIDKLPVHAAREKVRTSSAFKTLLPVAIVLALFYPPTLTVLWQNVIVTQIGVFVLLAVGLNVVVGWAGLLDLGYIAFYGIGSYTTAYFTGSLPVKPPSWLHFFSSPLWSIPFAIIACLIAGVLLGAPTLRLRGDYLAIVTLGFGEIIQIIAINNPGNLTGGPRGPSVPNPVLEVGPLHIHWGLDNLPYWYLLVIFIVIMVILFYRLEGSRLGRAWAAIREDEVAAQATGINTTRAKLLAFAIGASTSGLAGVFFATQVGYFDPSEFTILNSILIVAYVVFGGMGSLPGAMAGAAVLTWLPQFLKDQVPTTDRFMWIGALVVAMMIFRPAGLIPARRRRAELEGLDAPASSEVHAVPLSEGL
jgi:ABC-type branched-subunit amino acid transport system permease subunit